MSEPSPNPDDYRGGITLFVAIFTFTVAAIAVALRTITRGFLIHQFGLDDCLAIIALFLVFGCDFAVTYNLNYGLGRHVGTFPPSWIPLYLRTFYVSIALYNASIMSIKMTFLAQFCRIFQNTSRSNTIVFNCMAGIVICWAVSQLLIAIFTCHPISGFWDPTPTSVCIPDHPFWEINAAGNIVTDVIVLITPIPILGRLNLPRRQKWILIAIFSLGLFTVCISLVRIRYLQQAEDFTYENVESSGWSMGELASGLTCACLPTLRPLLARCLPWLSTPTNNYYYENQSGSDHPSRGARAKTPSWKRVLKSSGSRSVADNSGELELGYSSHHSRTGSMAPPPGMVPSAPNGSPSWADGNLDGSLAALFPPRGGSAKGGVDVLQRHESRGTLTSADDSSDGVVGLSHARDTFGTGLAAPKPASTSTTSMSRLDALQGDRQWEREQKKIASKRWVQPAVQTEIVAPQTPLGSHPPLPASGIQVQRDVLQTKEQVPW